MKCSSKDCAFQPVYEVLLSCGLVLLLCTVHRMAVEDVSAQGALRCHGDVHEDKPHLSEYVSVVVSLVPPD